jgi:hypothetical protein
MWFKLQEIQHIFRPSGYKFVRPRLPIADDQTVAPSLMFADTTIAMVFIREIRKNAVLSAVKYKVKKGTLY